MPKASHQDLRIAFRELLASGACYHTASVFDPMSARIAADLGLKSVSWGARSPRCRCWLPPILR